MKKLFLIAALLGIGIGTWSCEEKLEPNSIFVDPLLVQTPFDHWLYNEYVVPYNMEVLYRLVPSSLDPSFEVTPAKLESAKIMSVLLKHLYTDLYAEVTTEGIVFNQHYLPKQVVLVGSGAYMPDGQSQILGQASGGKSMYLYALNDLALDMTDPDKPVLRYKNSSEKVGEKLLGGITGDGSGYFHTIHHEFGHILHQMKMYDLRWSEISAGLYIGDSWQDIRSNQIAQDAGFISTYAMSQPQEDFVETYSYYICTPANEWEEMLRVTSPVGQAAINAKVAEMKKYLQTKWDMDLDHIREVVLRRAAQLDRLNYIDLN